MSDLLKTQLEAAWRSGELVGFHRWSDVPSKSWVGTVGELANDSVLFRLVDNCGRPIGDEAVRLADIGKIHRGSAYLIALAFLIGKESEIPRGTGSAWTAAGDIRQALGRAKDRGEVVTLRQADGEMLVCFIRQMDEESVAVECVVDGIADGVSTLRLSTISSVREGSESERCAKILYDTASSPF
jgi:hypothetical protein